jgi:hypothetical protein
LTSATFRNESQNHGFLSLDETVIRKADAETGGEILRDWSILLGNYTGDKSLKR